MQCDRNSEFTAKTDTLIETAVTFYMLQACMQGNFLFKKHRKFRLPAGKKLMKLHCSMENPGSNSLRIEKSRCNF